MATYVIGDVQGCYAELRALLDRIGPASDDRVWFVGDLVNRGPDSLAVLRFVEDMGDRAVSVLGNHDLHLLCLAEGLSRYKRDDTCRDVLESPARADLLDWLRHRPLLHYDAALDVTLVHAGLAPQWDIATARACATEVEAVLRGPAHRDFMAVMYGDEPSVWDGALEGPERWRCIVNALTRLRYCDRQGRMHLRHKGSPDGRPDGLVPWFEVPGRASREAHVVFGHWSTLGRHHAPGIDALDTGCLWGGSLTALRLEDGKDFTIGCRSYQRPG